MTCPPRAADTDRTVLQTTTVNANNGWWTGIVQDRDPDGETRLQLERWVNNEGEYDNPHTWRVRPDFWNEERATVSRFQQEAGRNGPTNLPIDDYLTPLEAKRVRKDDVRWVEVVRVANSSGYEKVRIYHWDPADGSTRQKWTVGQTWSQLEDLATRHLSSVA